MRLQFLFFISVFVLLAGPVAWAQSGEKSFLPGLPGVDLLEDNDSSARGLKVDETDVIRELYQALEDRFQDSGYDVRFELGDFRTVYGDQLADHAASELITPRGGRVLDLQIIEYSHAKRGTPKVHFKPIWNGERSPSAGALVSEAASFTVAEALEIASVENDADLARAEALTSFQVRVELDGEERSYRAAVVWAPALDGSGVDLWAQDAITSGLEEALLETGQTTAARSFEEADLGAGESSRLDMQADNLGGLGGVCADDSWDKYNLVITLSDGSEHSMGNHSSTYRAGASCVCELDCLASCTPRVGAATCADSGSTPLRQHKLTEKISLHGDDDMEKATCREGFGCMVKSCAAGVFCSGLAIVSKLTSGGVSFSTTGSPLWDGSISDKVLCQCEVLQPVPQCV